MPSEGMPAQAEVEAALFELLKERQAPVRPDEAYKALARKFSLTREQQTRELATAPRSEWENLVRFAKRRLVDDGIVESPNRGQWQLTEAGRTATKG